VFANKLSAMDGLTPAYGNASSCGSVTWNRAANGYRLPTEAEWEYAARAGTRGVYAGGELDAVGWYYGNSGSSTHPVARKQANAWGLYDMTGNVWEWTWDWYVETLGAATDPEGALSGVHRVSRGGNWWSDPRVARVPYRGRGEAGGRGEGQGVRLARTVP